MGQNKTGPHTNRTSRKIKDMETKQAFITAWTLLCIVGLSEAGFLDEWYTPSPIALPEINCPSSAEAAGCHANDLVVLGQAPHDGLACFIRCPFITSVERSASNTDTGFMCIEKENPQTNFNYCCRAGEVRVEGEITIPSCSQLQGDTTQSQNARKDKGKTFVVNERSYRAVLERMTNEEARNHCANTAFGGRSSGKLFEPKDRQTYEQVVENVNRIANERGRSGLRLWVGIQKNQGSSQFEYMTSGDALVNGVVTL